MELGQIREEHKALLEQIIAHFKQHGLVAGIHGTSLWNRKYKDVDLLVSHPENNGAVFVQALEALKADFQANIKQERGTLSSGLDYDIDVQGMWLHLSFVILL